MKNRAFNIMMIMLFSFTISCGGGGGSSSGGAGVVITLEFSRIDNASGLDPFKVTASVSNNGAPVTGADLSLTITKGTVSPVTDNGNGTYEFTVTPANTGEYPVTVSYGGVSITRTPLVLYDVDSGWEQPMSVPGYVNTAGLEIEKGRNFSLDDVNNNRNYVVIGSEIAGKLFPNKIDPIDKIVTIGSGRYKVIGTLKTKGSSMGMSTDNLCIIPYSNMRQYFSRPRMNYSINIKPNSTVLMDAAIGEAEGVFRVVRNLDPKDESDFNINKSDTLVEILLSSLKNIRFAAIIIGVITLFGAVIGLMNIMLVSVTERTREIGIRKAMGAKSRIIKQQFLFEAIVIGQLGGAFGIILGILIGNVVSLLLKTAFVVPWEWIGLGVFLCFIVGIVSGYFPAVKAAKQDPIEALRYE